MASPHSAQSRATTASLAVLTLTQAARLARGDHHSYVAVMMLAVVVLLVVTTVTMHVDNRLESRMGAGLLSVLSAGGVVLTAVAGLPGQGGGDPVTVLQGLALVSSVATLGLLGLDRRRQLLRHAGRSPYAS